MKKLLVFLSVMFVCNAYATTVNIDWDVDNSNYAQTTCQVGGTLTLPAQAPTKYGYTFVGWKYDEIYGTVSQSGTPTPTNPIYPVSDPLEIRYYGQLAVVTIWSQILMIQ